MKTRDLLRLAREHGWLPTRQGASSHLKLHRPGCDRPLVISIGKKEQPKGFAETFVKRIGGEG